MKKRRVVVFSKLPPPETGMARATKEIVELLQEERPVSVIDTSSGAIKSQSFGVRRMLADLSFAFRLIPLYWNLWRTCRRGDIVYFVLSPSLGGHMKNLATVFVAKLKGAKLVAHIHNGDFVRRLYGPLHRPEHCPIVHDISSLIVLDEKFKDEVCTIWNSNNCYVLRNSVDDEIYFTSDEARRRIEERGKSSDCELLFVSNMLPGKGHLTVLESLPYLEDLRKRITCRLVGELPEKGEYRRMNRILSKVESSEVRVEIVGPVRDRRRLKRYYWRCDLLMLPTTYANEAQPKVIVEALNAGVPVVATRHAGIPDMMEGANAGILIDRSEPIDLAEGVASIVACRSRWKGYALAARRLFEERFSPESRRQQLADIFDAVER